MLGYDTFANKLAAVVVSGVICAAAGAAYALLFGYVGSTLRLGAVFDPAAALGAARRRGHHARAAASARCFMYYVVDVASGYTSAYMLVVGVALILLVLFFPKGVLGTIRERWLQVAAMTPLLDHHGPVAQLRRPAAPSTASTSR